MLRQDMRRRSFLKSALGAGVFALGQTPFPSLYTPAATALDQKRRFANVKISRERLIRTVVGLRPYRPQGFVVGAERFDDKLIVHNYGHGGAGVTLSWGCADDEATEVLARLVAEHPEIAAQWEAVQARTCLWVQYIVALRAETARRLDG